jgi:hypothetical protein
LPSPPPGAAPAGRSQTGESGTLAPAEESGEKDIFETDFEVPALEEESGSEAVTQSGRVGITPHPAGGDGEEEGIGYG